MDITKLTMVDFSAWLKTQPPEKEYDYGDNENCLVAQYAKSLGAVGIIVTPGEIYFAVTDTTAGYPNALDSVAVKFPRTFGEAAQRADEYLRN